MAHLHHNLWGNKNSQSVAAHFLINAVHWIILDGISSCDTHVV
jgi:hypothetical protein